MQIFKVCLNLMYARIVVYISFDNYEEVDTSIGEIFFQNVEQNKIWIDKKKLVFLKLLIKRLLGISNFLNTIALEPL